MNTTSRSSVLTYGIAILGTLLIVAGLVWIMRKYTTPPPVGQGRAEERYKALKDIRLADTEGLNNYGWVDQSKGVVRLPINRAMELTLQEYKEPAKARQAMVSRAEKVNAAPPKAPEAPNKYE